MKGKIVLLTGATAGIGKAAAIALAKQQFTVVIHGRDLEKTKLTVDEIRQLSGNDQVGMLVADLFRLNGVRSLAASFKERYDRLDVLINNAGALMGNELQLTQDGIEKTFAINVLAPFLLTGLLSGYLAKSSDGRVINVSSNSHALNAKPDFDDLQLVRSYNPLRAYGNSKLFLIWNSQHLAEKAGSAGFESFTVNTVHPGAVKTGFGTGSDLGPVLNFLAKLARPFFRTPEKGAETLVYLAASQEVSGVTGKYFVDRKARRVAAKYYSKERELLVWGYCQKLTGIEN